MKLQIALYVREVGPSCRESSDRSAENYLQQEASWFVFIT
jgi:hypothetical protein